MNRLDNGTLVGIPQVKPVTTPSNMKCEDSLCNAEKMTLSEQDLLLRVLDNYWVE